MAMTSIKYMSLGTLTAIALACAGCRSEASIEPEGPEQPVPSKPDKVTLCLDVSYDVNGSLTRADNDPNGGYEGPEGVFEQINSLRVIIVRNLSADKTLGTVEANRLVVTTPEGFPKYDNLRFEVLEEASPKRIYLVANEKSIMSAPTGFDSASSFLDSYKVGDKDIDLTKLAYWTVELPASGISGDETTEGLFSDAGQMTLTPRLPMTEFFDVTTLPETQSEDNIYYSHLFVTRTAAKATFFIDQANSSPAYDNVKINAVKLSGIGLKEYVFPHDATYSKGKYPDGSNVLGTSLSSASLSKEDLEMYITDFVTPTDNRSMTYVIDGLDLPIVDKTVTGGEREIPDMPFYFPESILEKDQQYEVSVLLSTGVWLTAPLETNILNIAGLDAVARNTHLKITLRLTPTNLEAAVTVFPYTAVNLNPEFGFSAPETDRLTVAPTMDLVLNGPEGDGLLFPKFESSEGHTIQNLYWVSSNPSIVLLGNEVTEESDQRYITPAQSIELPYLQEVQDKQEPVPVRVVPQAIGTTTVTAYSQSGLVARCIVTVK